jgi:hypothetical protein
MRPEHQPYGQAGLARAAGATGDESTFDPAWQVIWSLPDETAGKADALIGAAYGAASLGRLDQAEKAGEAALILSQQRGQRQVMFEAEAVLESVRMERRAHRPHAQSTPVPSAAIAESTSAIALAQQFVDLLETSAVA